MSGRGDIDHRRPLRLSAEAAAEFERDDCLAAIGRRRAAIVRLKAQARIDADAADHFLRLDDTLREEIERGLHRGDPSTRPGQDR